MSLRRTSGPLAVAALVALAVACGADDGETETTDPPAVTETTAPVTTVSVRTRTEVEHLTLDLVDTSRPTPAGNQPASDERELVTEVYVPAGTGPFPLIAFSHGLAGHPRKFTQLFQAWAEAGYAVAAPAFPLSNDEAPGGDSPTDLDSQPGDISFVIDEVLAASEDPDDPLYGSVDPDHIGVAGLSFGGLTTYGVAFSDCCADDRVTAVAVFDGAPIGFGELRMDVGLPLLIMHADPDPAIPYAQGISAYADAAAPKYLVTLHEVAHHQPYEDVPDPADELVRAVGIAFWDRYLQGDDSAEQRIVDAVTPASLATLESEPT